MREDAARRATPQGTGESVTVPHRRAVLGMAAAAVLGRRARAQEAWPRRAVRLIVPYSAGGSSDTVTRLLAEQLTRRLGQPFVVENRPGLAGTIGMDVVAKSAPDGHVLAVGTTNQAINETLQPRRPFVLTRDFVPTAMLDSFPFALGVTNSLPVRTLPELVAYARAHPGELNYGSSGPGSLLHLTMERVRAQAGIEMQHIPFRNYADGRASLVSGAVQLLFDATFVLAPLIKGGQIRGIATTGPQRAELLPELPTIAETWPGFEAFLWNGLFAPAGTPPAVVARINAEVTAVLEKPAMVAAHRDLGATVLTMVPDRFAGFLAREIGDHAEVVRRTGVRPE